MAYPKPTEEWLARTMASLEITREEALEVWMDDHDIDAGKVKPFDLDPSKQAVVKEMTKGKRKPTDFSLDGKPKRERKQDTEKREIIATFAELAQEKYDFFQILNPEREISFKIGENLYSLTLTRHRPPKK
jgi:dsDNA-binding SOS-regulon protein